MSTKTTTTEKSFTVTSDAIARFTRIKEVRMNLRVAVFLVAVVVGLAAYPHFSLLGILALMILANKFVSRFGSSDQSMVGYEIEESIRDEFKAFSGAESFPPIKKMLAGDFQFDVINADTSSTRWITKCSGDTMKIVKMRHKY